MDKHTGQRNRETHETYKFGIFKLSIQKYSDDAMAKKKINKKLSTHKKKEHEQLKTEQHEHFYKPNVHS